MKVPDARTRFFYRVEDCVNYRPPFQREYEQLLLRFATDDAPVKNQGRASVDRIADVFFDGFEKIALENSRRLDFEGLRGRLFSASCAPKADHPNSGPMLLELEKIFRQHASQGKVAFEHDTNIDYGQLR